MVFVAWLCVLHALDFYGTLLGLQMTATDGDNDIITLCCWLSSNSPLSVLATKFVSSQINRHWTTDG